MPLSVQAQTQEPPADEFFTGKIIDFVINGNETIAQQNANVLLSTGDMVTAVYGGSDSHKLEDVFNIGDKVVVAKIPGVDVSDTYVITDP